MEWFLCDKDLRHEKGKQLEFLIHLTFFSHLSKAVVRRSSSKYVFLKISQISQEKTCVGVCLC